VDVVALVVLLPDVEPLLAVVALVVFEDAFEDVFEDVSDEVEPLPLDPVLTDAVLAGVADAEEVPLLWVIVMAPTSEANDATLSAVTATRVRIPCVRRRRRRCTPGASPATPPVFPRRSWSRRIRSACSSGVMSLMACSVPSAISCDPMLGGPP
jgi:hypothetical protein